MFEMMLRFTGGALVILHLTTALWAQDLPTEVLHFADMVLYNGRILTADERFTVAEAVAIRDGKFLAVGAADRILKMAGPRTRKIDVRGRSVTPGFLDTHYHLDDYAMRDLILESKKVRWEGKIIRAALWWEDLDMALRDIKRAVGASKPGELVQVVARLEMEKLLLQLRREQLDAIAPNHPVIIINPVAVRAWAVNSKALEAAKIPPNTPGLPGDGKAMIGGRAAYLFDEFLRWATPIEEQLPWLKKRMLRSNGWGLTLVETRIRPSHFSALRELWLKGEMTVRFRVGFPGDVDVTKTGNLSDLGDDMLKVTGADGMALGGPPFTNGVWSFTPKLRQLPGFPADDMQELREKDAFVTALRYGWSAPNSHVIGDRAVYEYLLAIEEAQRNPIVKSSNQRFTMDHMLQARPDEIRKMTELGVMPSIAPWFLLTAQTISDNLYMFGADRVSEMMPLKSYIAAGIMPSLEADSGDDPLGKPLWKIQKAITRKDEKDGRVWGPKEKVSRQEALWMSTRWSAVQTGDEKILGSIEPGKLADLVVLERDYLTVPEDEIGDVPIAMTVVGGRIVYEKELKADR